MPEGHPRADRQQPLGLGRGRRLHSDPQPPGRPPDQHRVAGRVGRRDQQQPLRRLRQPPEPLPEAVLKPPQQPRRGRDTKRASQLPLCQPLRQLQQGQRVAARLGDEPLLDPLVQRPPDHRGQQLPGVTVTQPSDGQLRQTAELPARLARRDHQGDLLGEQPARHEPHRLRRGPVEPLRVIDHAQQRLLVRRVGQQAQRRQPHQKPVRRLPCPQSERHAERLTLRVRQPVQAIEQLRAQLLEGSVGQLHLRLDAGDPGHAQASRRRDHVLQQRGLARPGLAVHHQRAAAPAARRLQQLAERRSLRKTIQQHP